MKACRDAGKFFPVEIAGQEGWLWRVIPVLFCPDQKPDKTSEKSNSQAGKKIRKIGSEKFSLAYF
jgi:hypothetical protein